MTDYTPDSSQNFTVSTGTPPTVYTSVDSLSIGQNLYSKTGELLSFKIDNINTDESFDILSKAITVNFVISTGVSGYTIDGIDYSNNQSIPLAIGLHTLKVISDSTSLHFKINGNYTYNQLPTELVFVVSQYKIGFAASDFALTLDITNPIEFSGERTPV